MTHKELSRLFNELPELTQWEIRFIGSRSDAKKYCKKFVTIKDGKRGTWKTPKNGSIRLVGVPMNDPRWDVLGEPVITSSVVELEELGTMEDGDLVVKATTRSGTEYLLRTSECIIE